MTSRKPRQPRTRITRTLTDRDIVTDGKIGRRSLLRLVGASVVGATATATGCVPTSGLTDADTGRFADVAGGGRGAPARSGLTDGDAGRYADPAGGGRGRRVTDNDAGRYADAVGVGRGADPVDNDGGRYADPVDRD
ncbi:MAG: hypothetical protein V3R98_07140 [Alphaproteobacteria bacterium]